MAGIQGAVTGISSKLDTTAIIDAILSFDKQSVTLMQYDQTVKTNQIATYQAINTKLLAFQSQASLLSRTDTFSPTKLDISDDSYISAAAANSGVGLGTYSFNILALAQSNQIASQGFSTAEAANIGTGTVTVSLGDGSVKTINIDSTNNTLDGLKAAINNAGIGVKASVVNDGSASNPLRLILTSDKTGAKNKISFSSSLTGSKLPDFTSSSFDAPEKLSFDTNTTSNPQLGTTANYTGSANKTYTFTVAGNGSKSIGSGDITLNWTDGTNTGSVLVSSADTEVVLNGAGSDGLSLQFSAGNLTGGDSFQVQTFAPLLQKAQDAKISMGSTNGGGSPITVTSDTNFVKDVIPGVTLTLKKVTDSTPVTITSSTDVQKVEDQVNGFITKFNDAVDAINDQFKFDPTNTTNTGILFGDRTLEMFQSSLRQKVSSPVAGLDSKFNMLADIGIRLGSTGDLAVVDRAKLEAAIQNNPDDIQKLFTASGNSSNGKITFLSASETAKASDKGYDVNITQAATQGYLRGSSATNPNATPMVIDSTNSNLVLRVDGVVSDTITLTQKTYASFQSVVDELQQKINADSKLGKMGINVSYLDNGGTGTITLTSGSYGATSKVELVTSANNTAYTALGLTDGQQFVGVDVAGTINGEAATGVGQILTGNTGNKTTAGLKLQVALKDNEISDQPEGTIIISKGIAAALSEFTNSLTKTVDGTVARRTTGLQSQVDLIKKQVDDANAQIEIKRARLEQKFLEMEQTLQQLNSQSSYLAAQFTNLSSLFGSSSTSTGSSSSTTG